MCIRDSNYIELEDINKPFRGWKISFFEGGIRVPFILSWPDQIDPGLKFDKPVHHFDIFSTIASAANVQIPMDRKIDGVDLMPYIKGEKIANPHQTLFWRSGNHQAVLHENWKYLILLMFELSLQHFYQALLSFQNKLLNCDLTYDSFALHHFLQPEEDYVLPNDSNIEKKV